MSIDPAPDFTPYLAPARGPRAGRRATPAEALAAIPNGARVLVSQCCGAPTQLLEAMCAHRANWGDIEIVAGLLLGPLPPVAFAGAPFRFASLQPSEHLKAVSDGGPARIVPARFSDSGTLFLPGAPLAVDAVLIHVSPPGPEGRFSMGVSVGGVIDAVRAAPLVIAQVNTAMPYTFGAGELRRDEVDFLVEIDGPLIESRRPPVTDEARTIAAHILSQTPDEATLQFGLGAVPEAVMSMLTERRDLGVHSGMVGEGMIELAASGALTGVMKAFDRGYMVTAEVIGTRRLFDWAHRNPAVQMAPARYSHGVPVLARCHRFVSIQSAMQVALDGSINAESIGARQAAGPGGQPDYAEAAAAAPGGIAIHALPATAAGGKLSRIVRELDAGAIVTTPRYLADRVVTEFGVAQLRGRSLDERAAALRAIAHPAFWEGL